jgi:nicotinamide-nucleotide amidase
LRAAILAVGDELTCGYILDTNSQLISRRLAALPADVVLHLSVGDSMQAIQAGLHMALYMTDAPIDVDMAPDAPVAASAVIVAGGLGPTEDDLTRQAVAAHFGIPLAEDAGALAHIQERFAHRGRVMPDSNRIQAQVPTGSQIIHNPRGTAAGFYLRVAGNKHLFVTPGVPYEMEGMLESFILPRLQELAGGDTCVRRAVLKVYGLPESEINERIRPLLARDRNPLLGLLPNLGTITVEVTASGATPEAAQTLAETDLAALRTELGQYVISDDGRGLPQVVTGLLVEHDLTVAVAEIGTGGLLAARLTAPEGAERWFRESRVVENAPAMEPETLARALAARQATAADVGVGVGAIVVPADSTPRNPRSLVSVAVNLRGQEVCRQLSLNCVGERAREWAADGALALVREFVIEL